MDSATPPLSRIEAEVQAIGRDILSAAREGKHDAGWGDSFFDALLGRLMADDALRTRMLRFVDVLPALTDDAELVAHLDEYLGDAPLPLDAMPVLRHFPGVGDWVLRHTRKGIASRVLAAGVRASSRRLAGRFIAGDEPGGVVRSLHKLRRRGMAFTLDLLGEATVSEAEADAYRDRYLALLDELPACIAAWPEDVLLDTASGRAAPRLNLSIKVSALDSQIDPVDPVGGVAAILARLRPILLKARAAGAFINLDMEQYDTKEITLRVFRGVLDEPGLRDWPDVGIALQAYLRDTPGDVDALIAWAERRGTPVTVRLVRGAYWDYETVVAARNGWPVPVWMRKEETDLCYESCAAKLIDAHPRVEAALATHNARSLAVGLALARRRGLRPGQYEFQMLYGMADPIKRVLVERGEKLRVYVPFGEALPGMSYLVRRLLENTSSQSFLRMGLAEDEPAEVVLRPPGDWISGDAKPASVVGGIREETLIHESVARFTTDQERESFAAALRSVRGRIGRHYPVVIGGEPRDSLRRSTSINPSRPGEVIGTVGEGDPDAADHAVAAAREAFGAWACRPAGERAALLRRVAGSLRNRKRELAAWEVLEAGKPWREADADVAEAIDFCEYYAREWLRLSRGVAMNVPGETNDYFFEPRGVAAVIAPWNFPLAILTGMVAAAVVTGNTVVMKPAPQTPVIAAKLMEAFTEAGVPPGVVNFLPGSDETGAALVRHAHVHVIAFTGSEGVGKEILAEAAKVREGQTHIKRVVAEMGGKNAIIVGRDADLDDAVRGVVASAFGYAGQKCSACSRVIVVGGIHDGFVRRLVEASRSLRVAPADDPGAALGPVIDEASYRRILKTIDDAGALHTVALHSDVSTLRGAGGYFIGPTIFTGVEPESPLAREEVFGPVLAVLRAGDFDEAMRMANATRFALTGGVYSRSPGHLEQARREFRVGNLYLNRRITGAIVGRQPFGGFKMSGVGSKAGGPDYLLSFVEPRTITENTIRRGFAPGEA